MVNLILYLIVCCIICVTLLTLNMYVTTTVTGKKMHEAIYTLFLAILCGFIISIIPYICLLSISVIELSPESLKLTLKNTLYTFLFCFVSFWLMSLIGKIAIKPSRFNTNKKKGVIPYLVLSVVVAAFIVIYIVYLLERVYSIPLYLNNVNVLYTAALLTTSIYNIARIIEHLHIDQLMINRSITYTKSTTFYTVFSISFGSIIYMFIQSLFQVADFSIVMISILSVLILFIITINYIENQLIYQNGMVENQNMKLKINEQQYRSLFQYNPNAIFILDLKGNFKEVNPSVLPLTGYTLSEILQSKITDLVLKEETERLKAFFYEVIKGNSISVETFILTKNKQVVNLNITASQIKIDNSLTGIYVIAQDITEQNQVQEKVNFLAYHDELTGLLNRRGIYKQVDEQINQGTSFATILIDVDMFKDINDHLGHAAGDSLLKLITMRLQKTIKGKGVIGRLGGDEFLICLTEIKNSAEVKRLIKDIQTEMKQPFQIEGGQKDITLSIGISYYPNDGNNCDALIKHADMAMYAAKKAGRNNYSEYEASLEKDMLSKITMNEELKNAIEEQQFELYYQPKHSIKDEKIVGVEALIRWHHPQQGFVSPGDFIPIAEETNLIIPLGNWIIRRALSQFREWGIRFPMDFQLSINISPKQFIAENFIPVLLDSIEEFSVPPEQIDLEITESLAIENTELTREKINLLKGIGFKITMDDFGTGYTSLTYLSKFPLDRIKIDQSFIKDIPSNKNHAAIVQSLVSVAKNLDIKVTAEGVETKQQLQVLQDWDCDEIQGYFYSKPLHSRVFSDYWDKYENKIK
ncbi:EAL domain-containing protein [Niallia taxi]|uniref:EAL domain-containing protein n=1 Tax=Niallia taxi TaxID=2499688 RepID=UPI003981D4FC